MTDILKQYVTAILLDEAPKWKTLAQTGELSPADVQRLPNPLEEVRRYVGLPYHYIHFAKFQKIGVNPRSAFSTPIGIYAYPLTKRIFEDGLANKIPFASSEPYIVVFKATNPQKLLQFRFYNDQKYLEDVAKLRRLNPQISDKEFNLILNDWHVTSAASPAEKIWRVTNHIPGEAMDEHEAESAYNHTDDSKPISFNPHPREWRKVFLSLGYEGVQDEGHAIIYSTEPAQTVFFSKSAIEEITSGPNPFLPAKRKQQRDHAEEVYLKAKHKPDKLTSVPNLFWIAKNPKVFSQIMLKLKEENNPNEIASAIMAVPNHLDQTETRNSVAIVMKLFGGPENSPRVRLAVATKMPSWIIGKMKEDPSAAVRKLVADKIPENEAAAMLALEEKRTDSDRAVKLALKHKIPRHKSPKAD